MGNLGYNTYSGWWQLKYFSFPTPIPGEKIPILTHIFSDGWFNHQLVNYRVLSHASIL